MAGIDCTATTEDEGGTAQMLAVPSAIRKPPRTRAKTLPDQERSVLLVARRSQPVRNEQLRGS